MFNFGHLAQAAAAAVGALFFATISISAAVGPAAAPEAPIMLYAAADNAAARG